jgi:hypothetical protein
MKKSLLLAALALAAFGASAQVTGSLGGNGGPPYATFGPDGLCSIGTPCTLTGSTNSATIVGGTVRSADNPVADIPFGTVGSFLAAGPSSTDPATMTFATAMDSISFLWGSPDTYNTLTVLTTLGSVAFTTASLGIVPTNGDQSFSQYVTFNAAPLADLVGLVFASNGTDAFEVSNFSRLEINQTGVVPEPETYALFGAGLAALAFMQRRRKKGDLRAA